MLSYPPSLPPVLPRVVIAFQRCTAFRLHEVPVLRWMQLQCWAALCVLAPTHQWTSSVLLCAGAFGNVCNKKATPAMQLFFNGSLFALVVAGELLFWHFFGYFYAFSLHSICRAICCCSGAYTNSLRDLYNSYFCCVLRPPLSAVSSTSFFWALNFRLFRFFGFVHHDEGLFFPLLLFLVFFIFVLYFIFCTQADNYI